MSYLDKIKSKDGLKEFISFQKTKGNKVVQCHGCFDIIHPGHIRYLEQAKSLGNKLVVSLTPDKFILKGDTRPFMPEELRVNAMAALEIVDAVYLDGESWAGPILKHAQPNIYVKGKEYESIYEGVFGEERSIVESYGGTMHFTSGEVVFSSSKIIEDYKKKFALDFEVFSAFCQRNGINFDKLSSLISNFKSQKIAVVGEVLVDEYIHCNVVGLSSEAPIPTIRPIKTNRFVGAAGIVAKHIASFGGNVTIFSSCGDDSDANYIESDFKESNVSSYLIKKNSTIRKVRFIGEDQKLLKVDYSAKINLTDEETEQFISQFKSQNNDVNTIVFSDFNYGLVNNTIREEITAWAKENDIKIIADVSSTLGGNISKYKDCFLVTPTEKEARMIFDDKDSGLSNVAYKLLKLINSENIVITLGANGLLAFKNKGFKVYGKPESHLEQEYIPAIEKNAIDPVGAGDAMLAMISLVVTAGGSLSEAVYLGNIASYMEVNIHRNKTVPISQIMAFLENRNELKLAINA